MDTSTKNILIIGALAVAGFIVALAVASFIVYKKFIAKPVTIAPQTGNTYHSTAGTGQSVSASTQQGANGDANFFNSLGSTGQGLNQSVSAVESTYNSVYTLLGGGGSTSTDTGQGNNGTAG